MARDIFASSPAGSASGFAVILVANSFILATFDVCVGFWLLFFPFGCSFACCSCVFFWSFVVGCLGGLGPTCAFLFPFAGVAGVALCGACAAALAYDLGVGSGRWLAEAPEGGPSVLCSETVLA